jgi:hypothetical protein
MISAYYISTPGAFIYTNRKRHLLQVAAIAAYLARVSWVHSFKRPASVFSFAFRNREKAPPGHVADCLGETVVFQHPAYVQIFDRDRVKSSDQIDRNLIMKILATARHFHMRFGDFDSLLRAPLRSLFPARKPPLLYLQIVERLLEMARIFDLFAGRKRGEVADADIHADGLSGFRQWFGFGYFTNQQNIPTIDASRDPKLFAFSFNRAGEPDATCADTGNRKFVTINRAGPSLLVFLREGVIAIFALESGESRFLSILDTPKETFESFVETFKRIYLDCSQMALYFGQCASFSQMPRLLVVTERCAGDSITRNPLGKGGVIDLAGVFKLTLAGLEKLFISAKLELESLDCGIF